MICYPNAKINLGLRILSKRKDGLHDLESFFLPISLYDILEVKINLKGSTQISYSGMRLITKKTDLVIRAYNLLRKDFSLPNISIHLHKNIPIGSGLGGGSSNASFMLIMLNKLFDLKISKEKLLEYACLLGSDCAFFLFNTFSHVSCFGHQVVPQPLTLHNYYIVMIKPRFSCSTAEIFSHFNLKEKDPILCPNQENITQWKDKLINDLEEVAFNLHPELHIIKNYLYSLGAIYASMTGSGSSVYGLFEKQPPKIKYVNSWIWKGGGLS